MDVTITVNRRDLVNIGGGEFEVTFDPGDYDLVDIDHLDYSELDPDKMYDELGTDYIFNQLSDEELEEEMDSREMEWVAAHMPNRIECFRDSLESGPGTALIFLQDVLMMGHWTSAEDVIERLSEMIGAKARFKTA